MQKVASLVAGFGAMAMIVSPTAASVAPATTATPLTTVGVDPAIVRAAVAPVTGTTAPTGKIQASGTDTAGVKCVVKFFEPDLLKAIPQDDKYGWDYDFDPVIFLQTKLICTDTVGVSEILIEQNDQLVVAGTITNNQTDVTLHNITVKLNDEQQDTFCVAVARQTAAGGAFAVVAQECFHGLGQHLYRPSYGGGYDMGYEYSPKGAPKPTSKGGK